MVTSWAMLPSTRRDVSLLLKCRTVTSFSRGEGLLVAAGAGFGVALAVFTGDGSSVTPGLPPCTVTPLYGWLGVLALAATGAAEDEGRLTLLDSAGCGRKEFTATPTTNSAHAAATPMSTASHCCPYLRVRAMSLIRSNQPAFAAR